MKKTVKITAALSAFAVIMTSAACTARTAGDGAVTESEGLQIAESESSSADATAPTLDMSDYSFDTVYGSQLINYLDHQYTFNGENVPLDESNFYFIDAFMSLTQYATYGMYPTTVEGYLDLSAAIDDPGDSGYTTYGDFFVDYAERMLESTLIINDLAEAKGLTLTDEMNQSIDTMLQTIETESATPAGLTLDEYLAVYYGPTCNTESFRTVMEHYYMADVYTNDFIENYEYDESEIMVPNIRYALYYAPEGQVTDEEKAEQQARAQAAFEECTDLDMLAVVGATSYTNGECYQYGEVLVREGQMDQAFEDWAMDPARQVGDVDLIESDQFGYFIVGYTGLAELPDEDKEAIAVSALSESVSDQMDNGSYQFGTDIPFETPSAVDTLNLDVTDDGTAETAESFPEGVNNGSVTGSKALDIVFVVMASIGCVAVVGAIVFGVAHAMAKKKPVKAEQETETTEESEEELE